MSRKPFKTAASSGRIAVAFGGFGASTATPSSVLSYVQAPLDFQTISDPATVVIFKNLLKRDDTTKSKALEDLQAAVDKQTSPEDGILDIWTQLFPRLSIDNTRRVRQLTQSVNGKLCVKAGKRIAKYMPQIVAPWLSALYDNDRIVAKAAQDALETLFPDADKRSAIRKIFHQPILEYCKNAVLYETVSTLSDERTVSKDDADATYARVVASTLALLASLVEKLGPAEVAKHEETYFEIFDTNTLELALHSDASIRRATHRWTSTFTTHVESVPQRRSELISKIYVYKGLHSDQTASNLEYVSTLVLLTTTLPTIWTDAYSGKKPALSRLMHYLKQGSQGSTQAFWGQLSLLFDRLPASIIPLSSSEINDLLAALRSGLAQRQDRFSAGQSWRTYKAAFQRVLEVSQADAQAQIFSDNITPLLTQYLFPSSEDDSPWIRANASGAHIIADVIGSSGLSVTLNDTIPKLNDQLIEAMKVLPPEQARDHESAQVHVASVAERWSQLQHELFRNPDLDAVTAATFSAEDERFLIEALRLISSRNGKPYGAAQAVSSLLDKMRSQLLQIADVRQLLIRFVKADLPSLIFTPSSAHVLRCLHVLEDDESFPDLLKATMKAALSTTQSAMNKVNVMKALFRPELSQDAKSIGVESDDLQAFIRHVSTFGPEQVFQHSYLDYFLKAGIISSQTEMYCIQQMVDLLKSEESSLQGLQCLQHFISGNRQAVFTYDAKQTDASSKFVPNVLRLTESDDQRVRRIAKELSSIVSIDDNLAAGKDRFSVIKDSLCSLFPPVVSVAVLAEFAENLLSEHSTATEIASCFPHPKGWMSSIDHILKAPGREMSVNSPFGCAVYKAQSRAGDTRGLSHDVDGLSRGGRPAVFFVALLKNDKIRQAICASIKDGSEEIMQILAVTMISLYAMGDHLGPGKSGDLFYNRANKDQFVTGTIDDLNSHLTTLTTAMGSSQYNDMLLNLESLVGRANSRSAYYAAASRMRLNIAAEQSSVMELELITMEALKQTDPAGLFKRCADAVSLSQVPSLRSHFTKLVNELIADLTGLDFHASTIIAEQKLLLLNNIFGADDTYASASAKQRIVFLVKHILAQIANTESEVVGEEGLRSLTYLMPCIADVYGEYWKQAVEQLLQTWTSLYDESGYIENVGTVYQSLRLSATLQKLTTQEDTNEDLADVLKDYHTTIAVRLVSLLRVQIGHEFIEPLPRQLTEELLGRQLLALKPRPNVDTTELFQLINSPSTITQGTAFSLMHDQIVKAQEQVSIDAALDKKTARLPDELLSLFLNPPRSEHYADEVFETSIPSEMTSYLYAWRLLFAHFDGASYQVKMDYTDQIKDTTYLVTLLTSIFDFLGHAHGKPVDVSKYDLTTYQPDLEPIPLQDFRWQLAHIYYLALLHLPSLVKGYVLDLRSRAMPILIEEWTAKHVSPTIITTNLQAVTVWSEKTVKEDPEYEKMTVKVGLRSKEVNVSYLVDEQTMAIKVVLPDAYPLAPASVIGISRVAVKEDQWQSWLRNCQGVITFSNGSITDGLAAWRRNVTGALKGQTECAICYSIISADKQLPTKKCPTCKNLFHSSCLFKWFKTSNASTCPLCRNPFNFN